MPDDEKRQKEIDDLKAEIAAAKAQTEAKEAEFKKTQREAKEAELVNSINWLKDTPKAARKSAIKAAMADVEDLSDETKVNDALKTVTEEYKAFISAEAPTGSGDKGGGGGDKGGGGSDKPATMKDIMQGVWDNK